MQFSIFPDLQDLKILVEIRVYGISMDVKHDQATGKIVRAF